MSKVILDHLNLSSADGTQLNMEALYQIAPSVFTETRDPKTGEVSRKVNFEALRQLLGDNVIESDNDGECYQFTWVGKNAAKSEAARSTDKTLRPVPEDSVDWENTKNLYIEGDNLEVLKLLQRSYLGKVKMIYIDPPYNTGNDFVYDDDFARTAAEEDLEAGNVDELGYRYRKNTDSNGKFHSDWCSMIYPRLLVARSLLTEDGVIFISIDDNEVIEAQFHFRHVLQGFVHVAILAGEGKQLILGHGEIDIHIRIVADRSKRIGHIGTYQCACTIRQCAYDSVTGTFHLGIREIVAGTDLLCFGLRQLSFGGEIRIFGRFQAEFRNYFLRIQFFVALVGQFGSTQRGTCSHFIYTDCSE